LFLAPLAIGAAFALPQAQSGPKGDVSKNFLQLVEVSHGFGRLLPHQTTVPDANGQPTGVLVDIRVADDLRHLTPANGVLPPVPWPTSAVIPSGGPGNHYLLARFDRPLDVDSILNGSTTGSPFTGAITVERVDPGTGQRLTIRGRGFVSGLTYGEPDPDNPGRRRLEKWVVPDDPDFNFAVDPRGFGFPGTEGGFPGAHLLSGLNSFVFVPDVDDDLSTHETFPLGAQIQMRITREVRATSGETLAMEGLASATVGPDTTSPEVLVRRGGTPFIVPADGAEGVDPRASVRIRFSEPIQPLTLGPVRRAGISPSVEIRFGPVPAGVLMPFTVRPISVLDLTRFAFDPAYDFPGSGPDDLPYEDFGTVRVRLNASQLQDLADRLNTRGAASSFRTARGPGIVNAPVTPDTIYVARGGEQTGVSVIDLNGFGAGTGNPVYDILHPIVQGNTNYPNNPNLALQGALLIPPLGVGSSTVTGGSEGPFTLTKDSNLGSVLAGKPLLSSVADMALGHALDIVYNNGAPFGCQAGGGNLCATTGLKRADLAVGGPNTLAPPANGQLPLKIVFGGENLASWAPHPNPPPLVFPPLCIEPQILGQEPTSVRTSRPPPQGLGLTNLLVPGPFPLGIPALDLPPQGTLVPELNSFFQGPGEPQPTITQCPSFAIRQQIGQFLYVADRAANQVVVLNSNRFTVLARIGVPDPTALAMSPNLDFLAVSSESTDQVFFIDVNPLSATFHQIATATSVGDGPRGIAWESGNEDILVCCTAENSVFVLSAFTLGVRKVLTTHISAPIDIALTPRQAGFGFARGVYFAYVLNGNGTVAVFESGPGGVNGFGFDDILGILPFQFLHPKAIQADVTNLNSAFFVLHEFPLLPNGQPSGVPGGALTRVALTGALVGAQPLNPGEQPSFRDLQYGVLASLGEGANGLSGVPTDIAFDDQRNLSALTNRFTQFSASQPLSINGKSLVKDLNGSVVPASAPQFLFLATPSPGVVDVFTMNDLTRVDTNPFQPGIQSIPVPGLTGLMSYFRQ